MARGPSRNFLLRLIFEHFEKSCRQEFPARCSGNHSSRLDDLYFTRIWFGAMIVVLIELVKISPRRKTCSSRQDDRLNVLIASTNQNEFSVVHRHKQLALVVECYVEFVCGFSSSQVRRYRRR